MMWTCRGCQTDHSEIPFNGCHRCGHSEFAQGAAIDDGTATAALCEDIAVPQDCQARAESIAQKGSHD